VQQLGGIIEYNPAQTFNSDNQIISKKYVDDLIDDTQVSSSKTYSSTKIQAVADAKINDATSSGSTAYSSTKSEVTYFKKNDVKTSATTTTDASEVYAAGYLNTQLGNKMSSTVTDAQNTGGKFWTQTGGSLAFKRIVGGSNVTVTENATNITIDSTGGGSSDGVLNNVALNSNGTLSLSTSAPATFNASFAPVAVSGSYNDLTNKPTYNIPTLLASKTTSPSNDATYRAAYINTINGVNSSTLSADGVLSLVTTGGTFNTTISSENIYWNVYSGTGDLPSASSNHGMFAHVHGTGKGYFAHNGTWVQLLDTGNLKTSSSNSATDVYSTSYIQSNFEPKLPAYSSGYLHYNGSTLTWSTPATGAGLPSSATPNHVLTWNGTSWVGQAVPTELPSSSTANYVLTWNGTSWVGAAIPAGVVSSVLSQYAASPGASDVYNAGYINGNNTLHNTRHTNLETKTQNVVTSAATHTEFTSTLNSVTSTVLQVGRPTSLDPAVQILGDIQVSNGYTSLKRTDGTTVKLGTYTNKVPTLVDRIVSQFESYAYNSSNTTTQYGQFYNYVHDETAGSESSEYRIRTMKDGTLEHIVTFGRPDVGVNIRKGDLEIDDGKITIWQNSANSAGIKFPKSVGTQKQAVTDPTASGLVLTSGAYDSVHQVYTWSWAAPSGGAPSYPKVDARSQSGSNLTLQNTNGTTSTITADGILWGWRQYTQIIENTLYCHRDQELPDPNGISWHNGVRYNETIGVPYMLWAGGNIIYSWLNGYQYRFNAIYFIRWYNTRFDWDFGVYGSNDKQGWTQLGSFNMNSTANFTDGKSSSTQTLGGTSITFPARTSSDAGIYTSLSYGGTAGNKLGNHIERFTFANNDYYRFYMLKHIGPSNGLTLGASMNMPSGVLNSMNEIEWG
jgi:hypothetical protein